LYTGLSVTARGSETSSATISSSLNPSSSGTNVTFTASVAGVSPSGIPTGIVNLFDGTVLVTSGILDSSGQTRLPTNQITAGSRSITAQYLGDATYQGSTSPVLTQVVTGQPPTISSISLSVGYQGTTMTKCLAGANLLGVSSVTFSGTGVVASITNGGSDYIWISIVIAADAPATVRNITVTTPAGSYTATGLFTVLQTKAPVISGLYPGMGAPGTSKSAKICGLNMLGTTSVSFSGTGVTGSISDYSQECVGVNIQIASNASLGIRSLTLTNAYGTSQPFTGFRVANQTTISATWKLRSYLSDSRTGTNAAATSADLIGSKIYASHGTRDTYSALLSIYDIATNTWTHGGTAAPDATVARAQGAGGTALGRHYAIGGFTGPSVTAAVESFDPSTHTWSSRTSMSVARARLGGAGLNNKIYAIGGNTGSTLFDQETIVGANEVYDPGTNAWMTLAPLPTPVTGNSATIGYNGKIYVFGGLGAAGISNLVQIYEVATNTWTAGTPMPTPRFNAMAGMLNGQIVVFGGSVSSRYDANGLPVQYDPTQITEIYDPASDTWAAGPDMKTTFGSGGQGATFNSTQIYAVAGPDPSQLQVFDASADQQPWISTYMIDRGMQGTSIYATYTISGLAKATSMVFTGTGVTAEIQPESTSTNVRVIISIAPTAPIGQRQISVNTATGSSGLSPGFSVTAKGNGNAASSITVSSSANPSIYGNPVYFNFRVTGESPSGAPTGFVNLLDGTKMIGSGWIANSISIDYLSIGSHVLFAQYLGDTVYQDSTSPVLLQVVEGEAPSIRSLSPNGAYQGAMISATVSGSNLFAASSVTFSGTGVTATIGPGGTVTSLPITITVAPDATASARTMTVTTPGGSSTSWAIFSVIRPGAPTITNVIPAVRSPSITDFVYILGTNMLGATSVSFSGTGVTGSVWGSSSSSATVLVSVASDAPLGVRSLTISNTYGTSESYTGFTVANRTSMPVTWKLRSFFNDQRTGLFFNSPSVDLIGTKIYASHGARGACNALLSVYDIITNTWTHGGTTAPDAAVPRCGQGAGGTAFGMHYGIGGSTGLGATAAVEAFDPSTGTWSTRTSLSGARVAFGGASLNNKIYAIGGSNLYSLNPSKTIYSTNEVYAPLTNAWTKLAPLPTPVTANTSTVGLNGKIYVVGGLSASGVSNLVQIYDIASNTWALGTPIPTPRFYAYAGVLSGQVVVFGGLRPAYDAYGAIYGYGALNSTEIYDPISNTWTLGPDLQRYSFDGGTGMTFNDTQVFAVSGGDFIQVLDATTDPQPAISSITMTSGRQGSSLSAVINGSGLSGATSIVFTGTGITAMVQPGGTSTSVPVMINITSTASTGQQQFSINTPTGSSSLFTGFTVIGGKKRSGQITAE
jgi:N-acetylneuraminic acid mutarotase